MVKEVSDAYNKFSGKRELLISYEDDKKDKEILNKLFAILNDQDMCFNCTNYYTCGGLDNYVASYCRVHGCLEDFNCPHHDADGSKCKDYKRVERC